MTTSTAFRRGADGAARGAEDHPARGSWPQESISYAIPTFSIAGRPVVYLAGWKKHISIYPIPELDEILAPQITPYLSGKGTAKFPLGEPIPYELIAAIVDRLVKQRG
jgi:uncharacterized protein YdhG (YjbR/CyaY superfamily)